MQHLSDAHHFRKMVAGACMVVAPLVLLVAMVIHPASDMDEATQVATIAANLDAWYVAHLLALVAIALMVPALLGLMHMLREREVAFGHVGGGLAMVGLLATTGLVAIDGFVGWQAAESPSAEMFSLVEPATETAGVVIPFFVMSLAFSVGMLFLAAGLYRARAVQSWTATMLGVGSVALAVGGLVASDVLSIVGAAVLFVGFFQVGRMVLRESDADWEHTPEYRGFRSLMGTR